MAKTVVILGGSYAGLHIAHALLKQKNSDLKVILVSKNSHFYWNLASVRAIVPNLIDDDRLFQPLSKALSQYPSTSYELIIGSADASDFTARTVTVSPQDGSGPKTLSYDQLVLATGSRPAAAASSGKADVPWKATGTYEETLAVLHDTAKRVADAHHIVVGGAGPTGVELAGELAFAYGSNGKAKAEEGGAKEIVLLTPDEQILGGDIIAANARAELAKLGVQVRTGAGVEGAAAREDGKTAVTLRSGEVIATDLYLSAVGLLPNSEYIDAKYLNEKKLAVVDEFFRVKGAEGVWAAGDLVSKPRAGFMITQKQAAGVAKNVDASLKGKEPVVVKGMPIDIFSCSVGRSRGAGRLGSFKILSLMVWLAKGRTLAVQMLPGYIDGSVA